MNVQASIGKGKRHALALLLAVVFALGLASAASPAYAAVDALDYTGDEYKLVKDNLTDTFGMLSPVSVSVVTMTRSDGKIHIDYEPSNKTVYAGVYLNADISDSSTWSPDAYIEITSGANITFDIDESYAGKATPIAPVKRSNTSATTGAQYYMAIPALSKIPEDGPTKYELKPINDEKMYVVVKVVLEDYANGQDYLTYYLNGTSYGYGFGGNQDDAVAQWDFDAKAPKADSTNWVAKANETISGSYVTYTGDDASVNNASKPGYRVPVTIPEGQTEFSIPVVAYASDFTARRFDVNLNNLTVQTGSASDTADVTVSSSVEDVTAAATGSLDYTGYVRPYSGNQNTKSNPLSNDWVGKLALNLGDNKTYDQIYVVTYQGQPWLKLDTAKTNDPTDADYATIAADGAVELPIVNEYDTTPKTAQLNGNIIKVKMHVAADADYEEADTWVDRTFQLDFTSRTAATLAISGDALTPKASVKLEDGIYKLPNLIAGSSQMFNHMEADSRVLIVSGDTATIAFTEDGTTASVGKYSRLALGKTSEILAGKSNYCPDSDLPEGTTIVEGVEQDKTADNARWRFDIALPKADVEKLLAGDGLLYVTVWNNTGSNADKIPGWYIPSSDIYLSLGELGELTTTQNVTFVPQDSTTSAAVAGATVTVKDAAGAEVAATDSVYNLAIGDAYTVSVAAEGYEAAEESYTVVAGEDIEAIVLTKAVLPDLTIAHGTAPVWVASEAKDISVTVSGLGANETVTSWAWEYSKDGQNWTKTGAQVDSEGATSTLHVPECTEARKPPMAWRCTVTTSEDRTVTSEGQSMEVKEVEGLKVVNGTSPLWVKGQPADISATVEGLPSGVTVTKWVWYYSKDNTTWKKSGAATDVSGTTCTMHIPSATEARKPPMAWQVRVSLSNGQVLSGDPQGFTLS